MSYTLGVISKDTAISINQLAGHIDAVRKNIDQSRIINEFGSISGFVFKSNSFIPPDFGILNTSYHEIKINETNSLWIVKYLNTKTTNLSGAELLEYLHLDKLQVGFLFYEETANWWAKAGLDIDFSFYPPWVFPLEKYIMLAVRDTTSFTMTELGKKWIEEFGSRGDYSFLFSDKVNELIKKSSVIDVFKNLISKPEIEYRQQGILIDWEAGYINLHLFESAWQPSDYKAQHAKLLSTETCYYYANEACVEEAIANSLASKKIEFKIGFTSQTGTVSDLSTI